MAVMRMGVSSSTRTTISPKSVRIFQETTGGNAVFRPVEPAAKLCKRHGSHGLTSHRNGEPAAGVIAGAGLTAHICSVDYRAVGPLTSPSHVLCWRESAQKTELPPEWAARRQAAGSQTSSRSDSCRQMTHAHKRGRLLPRCGCLPVWRPGEIDLLERYARLPPRVRARNSATFPDAKLSQGQDA